MKKNIQKMLLVSENKNIFFWQFINILIIIFIIIFKSLFYKKLDKTYYSGTSGLRISIYEIQNNV